MAEEGVKLADSETLQQILTAITAVRTDLEGLRLEMRGEITGLRDLVTAVDTINRKLSRAGDILRS